MNEQRMRKFFHFTEADLLANRRGQFSDRQKKRLSQQVKTEKSSARSSAVILFVIAAAGLTIGLTVGSIAPPGLGRILLFALMGVLWPLTLAGKAVNILLSARKLQEPRLCQVSGPVHIIRHGDVDFIVQAGGIEFDLPGNPSGVLIEGDKCTIYYLEMTEEIFSVEFGT